MVIFAALISSIFWNLSQNTVRDKEQKEQYTLVIYMELNKHMNSFLLEFWMHHNYHVKETFWWCIKYFKEDVNFII